MARPADPGPAPRRGTSKRGRLRGRSIAGLILVGFVLIAVSVIWRRSYGIGLDRTLEAARERQRVLQDEMLTLQSQIVTASSRARIVPIAERDLRMHYATDSEFVRLTRPRSNEAP